MDTAKDVVVVGAGLSGIACARALQEAGLRVRVLDRGHVPGGRMASRGLWGRPVDLGASYFTVSDVDSASDVDSGFGDIVTDWSARGLASPWTDTFTVLGTGDTTTTTGSVRWGAPRGLRSLVEDLAADLDVERADLADLGGFQGSAAAVVLAMPDPQARRLCAHHPIADLLHREWEPVIAVAARWPRRTWDDVSPTGRFDGAFVNGDPTISWVADDGRRRGDDAPVLVLHSTPDLAGRHLDDPSAAGPELIAAARRLMALEEPTDVHIHRWTFARPIGERKESYALVDGPDGLVGVCGDGWGATPKVETAWLSGRRLGHALVERLG